MGRPRSFDANEALDRALEVFWRRGYEGASLSELTEAMGITRPSLYAAFGNKEELFRKALDRYAQLGSPMFRALEEPKARDAIAQCLVESTLLMCSDAVHRGCLLVRGALACSQEGDEVKEELACRRRQVEEVLRDRLIRAKDEGELPPGASPGELAKYFTTVLNGISVQAAGGADVQDLLKVAEAAMLVWPVL